MDSVQATNLIAQNLKVYNTIAHQFSDTRQFVWDELKPLAVYAQRGDTVLDLGCGNGRLYQIFKDLGIVYVGVDQSEELLAIARKNCPHTRLVPGSMTQIPFAEKQIDIIYCIAAFQHIPSFEFQLQVLLEMKRVLKSGGRVVMTNWNLLGDWGVKQVRAGKYKDLGNGDFLVPWRDSEGKILGERYYHAFTPDELQKLFTEAGFTLQDQYYVFKKERSDKEHGENIISVASL